MLPLQKTDNRVVITNTSKGFAATAMITAFLFQPAFAQDSIEEALTSGKFILDVNTRFENVDHDSFSQDANGLTVRTRFGYGTGSFKGFKIFAEGDFTRDLGIDDFNSTVNGKTAFPIIADPNSLRLNRFSLTYSGFEGTTVKLGRQRIKLDNDRFVGNVGWRQNEQTYDALRVTNTSVSGLTLDYTFLWQVNRIFGSKSPVGKFDGDTHLMNAAFNIKDIGKLTGYGYFIKLDQSASLTNKTFGLRFAGARKTSEGFTLTYAAEYAVQKDYEHNTADFSLNYFLLEGGAKYAGFTGRLGYELLEGNGSRGFVTPLATAHKFQGFADSFLGTPPAGIEDWQAYLDYTFKDVGSIGNVKVAGWYHDFKADVGSEDLGEEFDLLVSFSPWKRWSMSAKFASHYGADLRPSVRKLWLSVGYKY